MSVGSGYTKDNLVKLETQANPCPCPVTSLDQFGHRVVLENGRPVSLTDVEIHIKPTNNMVEIKPRTIIRYKTVNSVARSHPPIVNTLRLGIPDKHLKDGTLTKGDPKEIVQQTEEIITTAWFLSGGVGFPDDVEAIYKLPFI